MGLVRKKILVARDTSVSKDNEVYTCAHTCSNVEFCPLALVTTAAFVRHVLEYKSWHFIPSLFLKFSEPNDDVCTLSCTPEALRYEGDISNASLMWKACCFYMPCYALCIAHTHTHTHANSRKN